MVTSKSGLVDPFLNFLTHMLQHTCFRSLHLRLAGNEKFGPIASILEHLRREQARSFKFIVVRECWFSPIGESEEQLA